MSQILQIPIMSINPIFSIENPKIKKDHWSCRTLTKKMEHLLENPLTEGEDKPISRINGFLGEFTPKFTYSTNCQEFQNFISKVNTEKATVIVPISYMMLQKKATIEYNKNQSVSHVTPIVGYDNIVYSLS